MMLVGDFGQCGVVVIYVVQQCVFLYQQLVLCGGLYLLFYVVVQLVVLVLVEFEGGGCVVGYQQVLFFLGYQVQFCIWVDLLVDLLYQFVCGIGIVEQWVVDQFVGYLGYCQCGDCCYVEVLVFVEYQVYYCVVVQCDVDLGQVVGYCGVDVVFDDQVVFEVGFVFEYGDVYVQQCQCQYGSEGVYQLLYVVLLQQFGQQWG